MVVQITWYALIWLTGGIRFPHIPSQTLSQAPTQSISTATPFPFIGKRNSSSAAISRNNNHQSDNPLKNPSYEETNNPSSPKDSLALSARASSEKTCRSPNHSPSSLLSCPTSSTNVCGTHNDASVFLGDQIVNYDPAWRVELCDKKCDIKCDINCDIKCFHFLPLSLSPEPMLLCLQIEESDK